MLLHRNTFVQKMFFYTQILLQRGIFARILWRRDAFTRRCFETRTHLGKRLEARFGEGSSYFGIRFPSIMFLQTDAVTYKCFYTGRGLHTEMVLGREMILQRDVFTYRRSYTEILSTQRFFCTRALWDTNTFYTEMILLRETFRRGRVYTHSCLFREFF